MTDRHETRRSGIVRAVVLLVALTCSTPVHAQTTFTYQGKLTEAGAAASGPLDLAFRLYDDPAAGNQVGSELALPAFDAFGADGTFAVDLDFGGGAFSGAARWLEVWVDGAALTPRQPIHAAPYAIYTFNGGTNGWTDKGGVIHTNADIGIGTTNPQAGLHMYGSQPTIRLDHNAGDSFTEFKDATSQQLRINKQNNAGGVLLDLNPKPEDGTSSAEVRFFRETDTTGPKFVPFYRGNFTTQRSAQIGVDGTDSFFGMHGGNVGIGTSTPGAALHVEGQVWSSGPAGGYFTAFNPNNQDANVSLSWLNDVARLRIGGTGAGAGGGLDIQRTGNASLMRITHSGYVGIGTTNPSKRLHIMQSGSDGMRVQSGAKTLDMTANALNTAGDGLFGDPLFLNNGAPENVIIGSGGGNTGIGTGAATLPVVKLHVDGGGDASLSNPGGGSLMIGNVANANIIIDNNEIMARNNGSQSSLFLNNEGGNVHIGQNGGTSTVFMPVLTITGGSDLSEMFDVGGEEEAVPGMVVCIDPENPGRLVPSHEAYDLRVAGIISGAGDVATGMRMGHDGTIADGDHPVALTGRVYCYVDATEHGITPGDMLTTSDTPGYAMKVIDRDRAQGAIIGKAMTSLERGETGLVLVLVTLQ